jgi:indolepyruvate ferredoxin oxidoreductase alpha subunit
MGAGGGIASGNYYAGLKDPVVQVIGDSAFLHAGIPGLINAVYNRADLFMLILDNRTTGMTGHQPHPAAFGITATNEQTKTLDIVDIVRAVQVDCLDVTDPYDYKSTFEVMKRVITEKGVRVVVSRRTCAVIAQRQKGGSDAKLDTNLPTIDREKCKSWSAGECNVCLDDFGCVAIMGRENQKLGIRSPEIDWTVCVGCQVCISKCEHEAIAQFRGEK